MKEEYANYDYQTTTVPLRNDLGITIGKEVKQSFKLCTKDCKYKTNWKELKKRVEKLNQEEDYEAVLIIMQELEGNNE